MSQIFMFIGIAVIMFISSLTNIQAEEMEAEPQLDLFEKLDAALPGRLLVPEQYDAGKSYPLVVFFHGAGERGDDNEKQLKHVVGIFTQPSVRDNFPCFVLALQCPEEQLWVKTDWSAQSHTQPSEPSESMAAVLKTIADLDRQYSIDRERIYAIGLSMGGYATWDIIARYPNLFAAAVPICGGGDTATATRITDMPLWIFHGDADPLVPVSRSRDMVQAIEEAGGNPRYTEYKGVGHDSFTPASREPELIPWLFEQRNTAPEMPLTSCQVGSGDRIVFLGDSITQQGVTPQGYVTKVRQVLDSGRFGENIEVIGAGISGNRVPDLLERLQRDVLDHNPTLVVVYIGINDVWHWDAGRGTSADDFRTGLHTLVQQLREKNTRVLLCTPTVIGEKTQDQNPHDAMLNAYADITRAVAREEKVDLLDLRHYFLAWLETENADQLEQGVLTSDGVHLNDHGNLLLGYLMVRAINPAPLPAYADLSGQIGWNDLKRQLAE